MVAPLLLQAGCSGVELGDKSSHTGRCEYLLQIPLLYGQAVSILEVTTHMQAMEGRRSKARGTTSSHGNGRKVQQLEDRSLPVLPQSHACHPMTGFAAASGRTSCHEIPRLRSLLAMHLHVQPCRPSSGGRPSGDDASGLGMQKQKHHERVAAHPSWRCTLRKHADIVVIHAAHPAPCTNMVDVLVCCMCQQGGARAQGDTVEDLLESLALTNPGAASSHALVGLRVQASSWHPG